MAFDQQIYRQAMGRFATGVSVVTAVHDGEPFGMTANSLTSISLDPTLLLVSFIRGSRTLDAVKAHGYFGVTLLDAAQEALSNTFASSKATFEGVEFTEGPHGVPLFPGGLGHFVCKLDRIVDGGDHEVVFGEVVDCDPGDETGDPLLFFSGKYRRIEPTP